ncbi:hypothetical protein SAMN05421874_111116 [Nonomuraea maritima]|uniref:Uncharacterized protein n=1 Tax=Nonomuraea maritima TaxID=683260 RepID=A0A1G9ESH7_9ACTN|nr:hypothetical protein SAMN05421874_111116 [Nonomuraea maritima]
MTFLSPLFGGRPALRHHVRVRTRSRCWTPHRSDGSRARVCGRTPSGDQSSPSRYRYDPADPTPTVDGTQVGPSAGRRTTA